MRVFLCSLAIFAVLMVVFVASAVIVGGEADDEQWPFDKPEDAMKLWEMYEGEDDKFTDD